MNRVPTALTAAFLVSIMVGSAKADEWDEFEQARTSYLGQNYQLAADQLEALIGGDLPSLNNETLLLESRKYLGAAYLFLDRRADSEEQFARLLAMDATYQMDPIQFPQAVLQVFDEVRLRVERAREVEVERQSNEERDRREQELRILLDYEQRVRELEEQAAEQAVQTLNSRWLAGLPLGVGQFRNGNRGLGTALAVSESLLLAVSVGTFLGHQSLPAWDPVNPPPDAGRTPEQVADRLNRRYRALEITNWVSSSALGALLVIGFVEAQVRFQPAMVTSRPRSSPASTGEPNDRPTAAARAAQLQLFVGFTGGGLRLSF